MIQALKRGGYELSHVQGSHHYFRKPGATSIVGVPVHGNRDLPEGTLRSIIEQAGLTDEEFLALRRRRPRGQTAKPTE